MAMGINYGKVFLSLNGCFTQYILHFHFHDIYIHITNLAMFTAS